jgi:hypothetical protein
MSDPYDKLNLNRKEIKMTQLLSLTVGGEITESIYHFLNDGELVTFLMEHPNTNVSKIEVKNV